LRGLRALPRSWRLGPGTKRRLDPERKRGRERQWRRRTFSVSDKRVRKEDARLSPVTDTDAINLPATLRPGPRAASPGSGFGTRSVDVWRSGASASAWLPGFQ